jgi:hypothetical protein
LIVENIQQGSDRLIFPSCCLPAAGCHKKMAKHKSAKPAPPNGSILSIAAAKLDPKLDELFKTSVSHYALVP